MKLAQEPAALPPPDPPTRRATRVALCGFVAPALSRRLHPGAKVTASRLHQTASRHPSSARILLFVLVVALCQATLCAQTPPPQKPIPIKVVVVTAFERGQDLGDAPGEIQLWVEREHLDLVLDLPSGYHHLRMNKDGVLAMVTGVGTAKAAASVTAVGLDPRFNFTKAYWIVAGIGGGDPADVSLGSAVWAEHVIDGDLAFEVDARQILDDAFARSRCVGGRLFQFDPRYTRTFFMLKERFRA